MNRSKCHFYGLKGPKRVKFGYLEIFDNSLITFFSVFCIQLLGDDIDKLSRDGFDSIIQKVIFKVEKVRFGLFSYNYQYHSVVAKCCSKVLYNLVSLLLN